MSELWVMFVVTGERQTDTPTSDQNNPICSGKCRKWLGDATGHLAHEKCEEPKVLQVAKQMIQSISMVNPYRSILR